MHSYYHFVRKTRRFSLIVLMNACLLALIYWAFETYLLKGEFERVVVLAAVVVIEFVLLCIAAYLWIINKQVEIRISSNEFYYQDPLFGSKELIVSVKDITSLVQVQSATHRHTRNLLHLKDGSIYELMYQNYSVDRQAMFDALKKANDKIELPKNIWAYAQSRPSWAKKLRKKIGLGDQTKT